MDTVLQDLRYAVRQLVKSPGFAVIAILTLAFGIGANSAVFSIVNGVLVRPLPHAEPERLVALVGTWGYRGELLQLRERAESFERIESYAASGDRSLTGDGEPLRVEVSSVTAGLFSMLGATPELGRTFLANEEWAGQHRVVVLSHAFWQQRYGGDPSVLDEQIRLDGTDYTVVGVMPSGFNFPSASTQLWLPFGIDRADPIDLWASSAGSFVARLRPAVTVEQAAAEVRALAPQARELFPWQMPADFAADATVVPLQERIVGEVKPALLVLMSAVGLVLLIACANVANLLLARATTRRQEMAIRTAIGAGRRRLIRQGLTESMVLAAVAGSVGILLAALGTRLLVAGLPADTPRLEEIAMDGRVLSATLALTFVTGLLFGALPALRASGIRLSSTLRYGGRSDRGAPQRRLSGSLVAGEMALAIVLVVGAMLLIRSFWQLNQVDPGFRTEGLVTATVAPPAFRYEDAAARQVFYQDLLQRLEALPAVQSVAATNRLPFWRTWGGVFRIEGPPDPRTEGGDWPLANILGMISEGYLATMGIPLLEGRNFTETDRADAPGVVIVSQGLAREFWPDESPIGKRLRGPEANAEWETIVGVVEDTRSSTLAGEIDTALYRPLRQSGPGVLSLILSTSMDPATAARTLREVVRSVDPDTPVEHIQSMSQLISSSVAEPRFTMLLLAAFAGVALLLGAIGIYGVLAYTVNERKQEIGIRMALGAGTSEVLRMVVRQGAVLAGIGIVIGLFSAAAGTRVLSSLLYEVSPTDTFTFAVVPALLLAVALVASYLPARRATRVDPMIALRKE